VTDKGTTHAVKAKKQSALKREESTFDVFGGSTVSTSNASLDDLSDYEDDELLLISPTRPVRSVTRQQSIVLHANNQLSWASRTCSLLSDSPAKKRLGSVARVPLRTGPPDDDGDESDDPMAI